MKRTVVAAPMERVLEAARSWRATGVLMMADIVVDVNWLVKLREVIDLSGV